MDSPDFFQDDCDSIALSMKEQEERIRLKRRWLLGLDMTNFENHTEQNHTLEKTEFLESEDHTPGKTEFLESECLPESLLREDDIFYEVAKSRVEEAFGFCKNEEVQQQKESKLCTKDVVRKLGMYIDSLTNKGLSLVAEIVTGDSTSFEKTRPKMKQIIRKSIRTDLMRVRRDDVGKAEIVKQLHQVLSDPGNFRKDCKMDWEKPMFPSHRDAAMKVLNELDKLSTQTLLAMKRRLEGSLTIPRLKHNKMDEKRIGRNILIKQVKQASEKMLSDLSAGEKLQEPLAKAMSLVNLSLQLSPGYNKTIAPTEFFQFSPETKKLQNEIVKAVWLLRTARIDAAFEKLRLILDAETKVSNHSLRLAVESMFIEYLFECCDMDVIPKSLTNALSFVNKSTWIVDHKVFPGEAVEEETECILNVSAQVKQIFWQCSPDFDLDQDFGDAYMEELKESDDDSSQYDDTSDPVHEEGVAECSVMEPTAASVVIEDLTESITRAHPRALFVTPTSNKTTMLISDRHQIGTSKARRDNEVDVDNKLSSRSLYSVENIQSDNHGEQKPLKRKKNQYLAVQEICDDTSLVAYNLIGRLLEKFADQKGLDLEADQRSYLRDESRLQEDAEVSEEKSSQENSAESITLSVVKEIMPSLDKSVLLKLKELMESQQSNGERKNRRILTYCSLFVYEK